MLQWFSGSAYCEKKLNVRLIGSNSASSVFFLFHYYFSMCFLFIDLSIIILLFLLLLLIITFFAILIMISPLLASGVRVGRLCWQEQGPVVLAAGGRPTNLDNGRAGAYCVCSRCQLGLI